MLVKWIRLSNVRSYLNAEVRFGEGITLLSGDIGVGKSSILMALEFALFGMIKGELSGSALLRNGQAKGFVEACISLNDREIVIHRSIRKARGSIAQEGCFIEINGIRKELTPVEMRARIFDVLGYPKVMNAEKNLLFRYTVYTPQEEMKRIIFANPEERLDTLRRLFGIDRYKRIMENAMMLKARLREDARELEGFSSDMDEKSKGLDNARKRLEDLTIIQAGCKPEIARLGALLIAADASISELNKDAAEAKSMSSEAAQLDKELRHIVGRRDANSANISRIREELSRLKLSGADISQREKIVASISLEELRLNEELKKSSSLAMKKQSLATEIQKKKSRIRDIKEGTKKLKETRQEAEKLQQASEKSNLVAKSDKIQKGILECEKSISSVEIRLSASVRIIENITRLDECPTCLQKVEASHKKTTITTNMMLQAELNGQLGKLQSEKTTLSDEIGRLNQAIRGCEEAAKQLALSRQGIARLEQLQMEMQNLEKALLDDEAAYNNVIGEIGRSADISAMQKNLKALRDVLARIDEDMVKGAAINEKQNTIALLEDSNKAMKERVIEINAKKIAISKRLAELCNVEGEVAKKTKDRTAAADALKAVEVRQAEAIARQQSIADDAKNLTQEIEKKKEARRKLLKSRQLQAWLDDAFCNIVSVIEKNIMASVHSDFSSHFTDWFLMLMPDDLIAAKLDDEFTPMLSQNGHDTEIENLSGGEKTALALSYRLALNKSANDATGNIKTKDIIILDEPTDGFSEQQLDKIRDVLEMLGMRQVIIVSHESKIESFVDNVIRIEKTGHESKVVV